MKLQYSYEENHHFVLNIKGIHCIDSAILVRVWSNFRLTMCVCVCVS